MKNSLPIAVALSLLLFQGCQSLGHNTSYLLQFKKEVREYYAIEEIDCHQIVDRFPPFKDYSEKDNKIFRKCSPDAYKTELSRHGPQIAHETKRETREELLRDRRNHLAKIYTTSLPFSATDHYDIRTISKPIRAGDPLNIIINKIHLDWNGEYLGGFKFQVQRVNDGAGAHRLPAASQRRGISVGAC